MRGKGADGAAEKVTLEEMLEARERRALRQKEQLGRFPMPLICFTLNLAGPVKSFPLARRAFDEGESLIFRQLKRQGISVRSIRRFHEKTGSCGLYSADGEAREIKALLCAIEENSPVGRLFDLDVLGADGRRISREDLGMGPRRCLICGEEAHACARSRAHPPEELERRAEELLEEYFRHHSADRIMGAAVRALLYEVSATPKPGLVDRENSGAHADMDFFSFLDSTAALAGWFRRFSLLGWGEREPSRALFLRARHLGRWAEEDMLAATGGANTHKGLIFSLGLLCVSAGAVWGEAAKQSFTGVGKEEAVLAFGRQLAAWSLEDFQDISPKNAASHGEQAYAAYGAEGIRREAAEGFPGASRCALPLLKKLESRGIPRDCVGPTVLLRLLTRVEDTNLLYRGGREALEQMRRKARALLEADIPSNMLKERIRGLDKWCVAQNLSPGGCADLLAIAYFLHFLNGK